MYRLLNKVSAFQPHHYNANHHLLADYSYPAFSKQKRDTRLEEDTPNPVKNFEIYGFSVGGYGRGKKENQDSFNILQGLANDTHFFAVYDGHGINGKDVSQYVKDHVADYMKKDADSVKKMAHMSYMEPFLKHVFKSVDNSLNSSSINTTQSGTCCNGVLVSKGKAYIANLGDSRAILCKQGSSGENIVMNLSQDHKPTRSDEQNRILQKGGRVGPMYYKGISIAPLRVWDQNGENGLAMTRSIGDKNGKKAGIISEPEIKKIDLEAGDKFIIVASDGIWDVMSSQEAADFVLQYDRFGNLRSNIPMALACEARRRWESIASKQKYPYCDDISVIVAFPEFN